MNTGFRSARLVAISCAVAILVVVSASISTQAGEPSYASRIGVFEHCLSIHNRKLRPGTAVTIIRFNSGDDLVVSGKTRNRRVDAKIVARTDSAEQCSLLFEERARTEDDFSIYTVSSDDGPGLEAIESGIGIVGLAGNEADPIDLDGNGAADSFSVSVTAGGLIFDVWKDMPWPWDGKPLWEGYYDVGHAPEE
jgi:hypothetical protein